MTVESRINTLFSSVSYAFDDCLIDPGDIWAGFESVTTVLLTHAHFDHIYGLNELFCISPQAKVYTNEVGKEMLLNARKNLSFYHETPFVFEHSESVIIVNDGDEIDLGDGLVAKSVFTPGHNPSCITWVIGDAIFSGDSLIPGVKTVTNLPGGSRQEANESEKTILKLIESKTVFPGHS